MARSLAALLLTGLIIAPFSLLAENKDPATKEAMGKVYASLSKVLPLSLSQADFTAAGNEKLILEQLKNLSASSKDLERHGQAKNRNFQFLSKSLARDLETIRFQFQRGQKEQARLRFYGVTDTCIACHSRLPASQDFTGAKELFRTAAVEKMEQPEKIQLLTATRQFEAAMEVYETMFSDPKITADDLVDWDPFTSYLILTTRVKRDPARAIRGLKLAKKKGVFPKYAAAELDSWIRSLKNLPKQDAKSDKLLQARKILDRGKRLNEYPTDRTGLVDFVYVSGLLLEYIEEAGHGDEDLAEAFYLLGLSDAVISRSYWIPQTDFFLETAVRMSPKSKTGKMALEALEDNAVIEFGGTQGLYLPPEFEETLRELRGLVGVAAAPAVQSTESQKKPQAEEKR